MNVAIILAGGAGSRMGNADLPKQYLDVYGKPLLVHTLEVFEACLMLDAIAVVADPDFHPQINAALRKYDLTKVRWLINNGPTRQASSANAIEFLAAHLSDDDIVVIHDAARPFVNNRIIEDNINGARQFGAVDTCINTPDTIVKSLDHTTIDRVPKRAELYLGQTPQSFRFKVIKAAHQVAREQGISDASDDCQIVLLNHPVHLVRGEKMNFKITTFADLTLMKALLKLGRGGSSDS